MWPSYNDSHKNARDTDYLKTRKCFNLKIKEDFDLTKLLDMGFYYDDNKGQYCHEDISFSINVWNRKINWNDNSKRLGIVLFDLISLNIVEKVEVKE